MLVPGMVRAHLSGPLRRRRDAWVRARFRRRHTEFAGERALFQLGERFLVVEQDPELTPLRARRATLDVVCAALTAARVPYFCVRTRVAMESAVAISIAERERAVKALRPAVTAAGGYVGPVKDPHGTLAGFTPQAWAALADEPALRITRFFGTPGGELLLGADHGCVVEFWEPVGGELVAPRPNRVAESIPVAGEVVMVGENVLTRLAGKSSAGPRYPTRVEFDFPLLDDITFPIDVVYTWVDGSDPAWRARREAARAQLAALGEAALNRLADNDARYTSRDELRYSLRSLAAFAPWVRNIYLVTDEQVPPWLDTADPRITVVSHKELFACRGTLPSFNSHAIESQLHHIEGLAEHFLYFNDDVFLGRPLTPDMFFHANGLTKFFPSSRLLGLGERVPTDQPAIAAGKNTRRIIEAQFGGVPTQRVTHTPHPLRRSVLGEIEERFAEESARTAGHQFRHPDDLSIPASLHHYYGLLSGLAVPGEMAYRYIDLGLPDAPDRMRQVLERRTYDCFCVNDTDAGPMGPAEQQAITERFLEAYFPVPSPYEIN